MFCVFLRQVVQSQLASDFGPDAFLADEAMDGSGSGDSPPWKQPGNDEMGDDEDGHDGDDDDEASGSGMGPTPTGTVSRRIDLHFDNASRCIPGWKLHCQMNPVYGAYRVSLLAVGLRSRQDSTARIEWRIIRICSDKRERETIFLKERKLVQFNYVRPTQR